MLDDSNVITQKDPSGALMAVATLPEQAMFLPELIGGATGDRSAITAVVLTGMGGSALAAEMVYMLARDELKVPLEIVKGYDLPAYVDQSTLVIALSHSGNTEETMSCYQQAIERGAVLAAMATGGQLIDHAQQDDVLRVVVPGGAQPRMSTVYHLRCLLMILQHFGIISRRLFDEVSSASGWLAEQINEWRVDRPTEHNYAKQIAHRAAGKTAVFYGGMLTAPLAYKWKISWNESSKNIAFWNQYPECNHNEFIGWSSHPVEKPFFVMDIISSLERGRIRQRMQLSDQMLSGKRPHAMELQLLGDTLTEQMLWGLALGDMSSIYLGILNGVDPAPVHLVEKFKQALG